jgi:hypothetical protein
MMHTRMRMAVGMSNIGVCAATSIGAVLTILTCINGAAALDNEPSASGSTNRISADELERLPRAGRSFSGYINALVVKRGLTTTDGNDTLFACQIDGSDGVIPGRKKTLFDSYLIDNLSESNLRKYCADLTGLGGSSNGKAGLKRTAEELAKIDVVIIQNPPQGTAPFGDIPGEFGGYIIKDKLWYFATYAPGDQPAVDKQPELEHWDLSQHEPVGFSGSWDADSGIVVGTAFDGNFHELKPGYEDLTSIRTGDNGSSVPDSQPYRFAQQNKIPNFRVWGGAGLSTDPNIDFTSFGQRINNRNDFSFGVGVDRSISAPFLPRWNKYVGIEYQGFWGDYNGHVNTATGTSGTSSGSMRQDYLGIDVTMEKRLGGSGHSGNFLWQGFLGVSPGIGILNTDISGSFFANGTVAALKGEIYYRMPIFQNALEGVSVAPTLTWIIPLGSISGGAGAANSSVSLDPIFAGQIKVFKDF